MRTLEEIRRTLQEHRGFLAQQYGVEVRGIFGSCARGEATENSDLDLLVEILRPISLLELVGAELYLSDLLGMKVDLVPKRSLRKELKETIFHEVIAL